MLHEFILTNRREILRGAQSRAALRSVDIGVGEEQKRWLPLFLDELVGTLRDHKYSTPKLEDHAAHHGRNRFAAGFSVTDVVRDYGDVCQVVTGLAIEREVAVTVDEFRGLNRCLDDAVAGAVAEYVRASQAAQTELTEVESERSVALGQQMRNHLDLACVSVEVLKGGSVAIGGRTGALLDESLLAMKGLLDEGFLPAVAQSYDPD
jgi:hypothetical protein